MTTKFKKKRNIYLLVILLIALILRLWRLGLIPPGLTPDEAALGYNAYSILKTGKDEYGNFFPIIFKSFGDWKPGLYVYITIPFVAVFGLSESAVRLPSTLAGVIAIWLFYQIILILYSRQKNKVLLTNRLPLANINAFLLAISPWHILFSRGAWEVNMSLTLTLAGIYFFLRSLNKSNYLYLSSISFALTFLSYQGAKLSTFIVILILAVIYRKDIKNRFTSEKKIITGSFFFGLMLSLPILLSMFSGKTGRLKVFTITSYPRPKEYLQNFLSESGVKLGSTSYYLFYSESLNYTRGILSRWFNHFSSKFLFFEGDWSNPRHSAPNHGELLLVDLFLLPLGFICLVKKGISKSGKFILLWLIFAPLPAILSRNQVHAVRALNMIIPLTMISSFGALLIIENIKKYKSRIKYFLTSFFGFLVFCSQVYFLDAYFIHLPKHNAKYWFYGYKEVVEKVVTVQDQYERVTFQQSYDQPYIYFLFYGTTLNPQKYNPASYQKQAKLTDGGVDVGLVERLGNIQFKTFSWAPAATKGDLVIGDDVSTLGSEEDKSFRLISKIKYPNDMTALRILEKL